MALLRLAPGVTFIAAAGVNAGVDPGPGSMQTINRLYVDTSAGAASITSFVAGLDGQLLWVFVSGANALTFTQGASLIGNSDITINPNDSLLIYYDGPALAWIL